MKTIITPWLRKLYSYRMNTPRKPSGVTFYGLCLSYDIFFNRVYTDIKLNIAYVTFPYLLLFSFCLSILPCYHASLLPSLPCFEVWKRLSNLVEERMWQWDERGLTDRHRSACPYKLQSSSMHTATATNAFATLASSVTKDAVNKGHLL